MANAILNVAVGMHLPPVEKACLIALANRARTNGKAWPSVATLMSDTGFKRRSIFNGLKMLELKGLITRQARRGHSSIYNVHVQLDCTIEFEIIEAMPLEDPCI